jgi:hypothetical protein
MQRVEASKEVAWFIAPHQAARWNQSGGGNSVQNLISTPKTTWSVQTVQPLKMTSFTDTEGVLSIKLS